MFLQRHGESETNLRKVFTCRKLDPSLTERGKQQIEGCVEFYRPLPIERIITSPSHRATQSAEILASQLDVPLSIDACLLEVDVGDLEGESELDNRHLKQFFDIFTDWIQGRWDTEFPGGESGHEVRSRAENTAMLLSSVPTVLVGHAAFFAVFLATQGMPSENVEDLFLPRAGIARRSGSGDCWRILNE
jgi:probable phosphoglycerate mutase